MSLEWKQSYANEDFDRVQSIALQLMEADRAAGVPAPAFGYSKKNIDRAWSIVKEAQR